jgi:hypothetical protein
MLLWSVISTRNGSGVPPCPQIRRRGLERLIGIDEPWLDWPAEVADAPIGPALWLEADAAANRSSRADRHTGPDRGPNASRRATKKPDPNVDPAENGEIGTAYRIPGEASHASQPSSETPTKRRMRRKKQDP